MSDPAHAMPTHALLEAASSALRRSHALLACARAHAQASQSSPSAVQRGAVARAPIHAPLAASSLLPPVRVFEGAQLASRLKERAGALMAAGEPQALAVGRASALLRWERAGAAQGGIDRPNDTTLSQIVDLAAKLGVKPPTLDGDGIAAGDVIGTAAARQLRRAFCRPLVLAHAPSVRKAVAAEARQQWGLALLSRTRVHAGPPPSDALPAGGPATSLAAALLTGCAPFGGVVAPGSAGPGDALVAASGSKRQRQSAAPRSSKRRLSRPRASSRTRSGMASHDADDLSAEAGFGGPGAEAAAVSLAAAVEAEVAAAARHPGPEGATPFPRAALRGPSTARVGASAMLQAAGFSSVLWASQPIVPLLEAATGTTLPPGLAEEGVRAAEGVADTKAYGRLREILLSTRRIVRAHDPAVGQPAASGSRDAASLGANADTELQLAAAAAESWILLRRCGLCGEDLLTPMSLSQHVRSRHAGQSACAGCGRHFAAMRSLTRHIREQHGRASRHRGEPGAQQPQNRAHAAGRE